MTTFDPDTLEHDPSVLRDIVKCFDGELALNSEVEQGGEIRVGQQVELLNAKPAQPKTTGAATTQLLSGSRAHPIHRRSTTGIWTIFLPARFGIVQKSLVSLLESRSAGVPIGIQPRQLR